MHFCLLVCTFSHNSRTVTDIEMKFFIACTQYVIYLVIRLFANLSNAIAILKIREHPWIQNEIFIFYRITSNLLGLLRVLVGGTFLLKNFFLPISILIVQILLVNIKKANTKYLLSTCITRITIIIRVWKTYFSSCRCIATMSCYFHYI